MIFPLVREMAAAGARVRVPVVVACRVLGFSTQGYYKWLKEPVCDRDRDDAEVINVLHDLHQDDPTLGYRFLKDELEHEGINCSENRVHRLCRIGGLWASHAKKKGKAGKPGPPVHDDLLATEDEHGRIRHRFTATGPNQVWSWDITYLRMEVRGSFFYLYMIEDIWSRKIVGWDVHDEESMELSAALIKRTCAELGVDPEGIVLHSDNGGPMKGATMLATLHKLGIVASFSRPRVSNDNPYSEALFRTVKYSPAYPSKPFASIDEARQWVAEFVGWYNEVHLHSATRFVTPADRHVGKDATILAKRTRVYEAARRRHPERWSGPTRNWKPIDVVRLNPGRNIEANRDELREAA